MRALLLSTVAFATLAGSAFAADLPSRKEAPVYVAPAPAFSWTGFYIGGDIGAAWATTTASPTGSTENNYYGMSNPSLNTSGFMGGGYVGYNYQLNQNFVVGLEGDFQGTTNSKSSTWGYTSTNPNCEPKCLYYHYHLHREGEPRLARGDQRPCRRRL